MKFGKKLISILLAAAMILSMFSMLAVAAEEVSFVADGGKRSTFDLGTGLNVTTQFKTTASFNKIGIVAGANATDRTVVARLYKWVSNPVDTAAGTPIAEKEYSGVSRNDLIAVEGNFPAGEYMLEVYIKAGGTLKLTWYTKGNVGFKGYQANVDIEGVPLGYIYVDGGISSMTQVTKSTEIPAHTAPPAYVITPDSPIGQLAMDSTTYSFVDGLGRPAVTFEEAGEKNDKKVGIFYWTWHLGQSNGQKPYNVTEITKQYPEAMNDFTHSIWKKYNAGAYWWNEPIWGYYTQRDDYVLRKHAELLADAGIDFVAFDATNGTELWTEAYMNLLKVWDQARKDGINAPQIVFMLPFWDKSYNKTDLINLYNEIYKAGLYQDQWFYFDGKPLVLGLKDSLNPANPVEKEILNFFTFRKDEPSYWLEDQGDDTWGWLHVYPQALYKRADGTVESTTVGVAMNANYKTRQLSAMNSGSNMGRGFSMQEDFKYTYTYRGQEIVCNSKMENAHYYGINFQEQWDFAIQADPDLVFVTGWNEWIAGRYEEWGGVKNAFPDQCDDANSRDIEPSKGELKDYFYYQLVNNVRKFKGMTAPVYQTESKTIDINGGLDQWNDEGFISFKAYKNNTLERDAKGWGSNKYTNPGIRNDIVLSKVAYDADSVYFYVETVDDITSYTDENWMRLLIDTGAATADSKDWEEFEYIVGRETGTANTLVLEKSKGGWDWEKVADVEYKVTGKVLQLKIKKADLGISGDEFAFNFKWADANLADGDIMTLYTDGDAAPLGRFTYMFTASASEYVKPEDPNKTGKGCFGVIGSGVAVLAALAVGVAVVSNRRKDEE